MVKGGNIVNMKEQQPYNTFTEKSKPKKTKESVKISIALIERLKANKLETGVNITAFIEQAVSEKLNKTK